MKPIPNKWRNRLIVAIAGVVLTCVCLTVVVPQSPRNSDIVQPTAAEVVREVTREVVVTEIVEVEVTRIAFVPVTVTPTATPRMSPTPSESPTITLTPTETAIPSDTPPPSDTPLPTNTPNIAQTATAKAFAILTEPKDDGFYLVNVDIAPGIWRSTGTQDGCYWETSTATGNIIDNHFGKAGGTAYVSASVFQVEFNDCGTWEYLSPP